ncbi:MAG: tyrosine-type recombinase/integrase [Dissulfurispiraceae bacterium]|jgi:integrase
MMRGYDNISQFFDNAGKFDGAGLRGILMSRGNGLYLRGRIWWMSFTANKQHYQRSTGTDDRKLAQKILSKVRVQIVENKWFDIDKSHHKTFDALAHKFIDEHSQVHKKINSQMADETALRVHLKPFFGGMTLNEITPSLISKYKTLKLKTLSKATVSLHLKIMSKMFNLAVREWEWCRSNPVSIAGGVGKLNNEVDRWLTLEEELKLLSVMPVWLADICIFALNTGMRQSEILSLTRNNVNLISRTATVLKELSKTGKSRIIPLNDIALAIIKKQTVYISGYVFSNAKTGDRMTRARLTSEYQRCVVNSGIKHARFHDLRHTFATRLIQRGIEIYNVSKLLGHNNISTTQGYTHHDYESLRGSVNVLDGFYAEGSKIMTIGEGN